MMIGTVVVNREGTVPAVTIAVGVPLQEVAARMEADVAREVTAVVRDAKGVEDAVQAVTDVANEVVVGPAAVRVAIVAERIVGAEIDETETIDRIVTTVVVAPAPGVEARGASGEVAEKVVAVEETDEAVAAPAAVNDAKGEEDAVQAAMDVANEVEVGPAAVRAVMAAERIVGAEIDGTEMIGQAVTIAVEAQVQVVVGRGESVEVAEKVVMVADTEEETDEVGVDSAAVNDAKVVGDVVQAAMVVANEVVVEPAAARVAMAAERIVGAVIDGTETIDQIVTTAVEAQAPGVVVRGESAGVVEKVVAEADTAEETDEAVVDSAAEKGAKGVEVAAQAVMVVANEVVVAQAAVRVATAAERIAGAEIDGRETIDQIVTTAVEALTPDVVVREESVEVVAKVVAAVVTAEENDVVVVDSAAENGGEKVADVVPADTEVANDMVVVEVVTVALAKRERSAPERGKTVGTTDDPPVRRGTECLRLSSGHSVQ